MDGGGQSRMSTERGTVAIPLRISGALAGQLSFRRRMPADFSTACQARRPPMSRIIPLDELDGRIPRAGKISGGYTDTKTTNGKTVTFPVKSRTLVFRGSDRKQLEAAAAIVGGEVSASPNPRAEGMWRLVSHAKVIDV